MVCHETYKDEEGNWPAQKILKINDKTVLKRIKVKFKSWFSRSMSKSKKYN